jgi:hypothetical protein
MEPRATWRSHQLLGLIPQTITTDYILTIRAFGTAPNYVTEGRPFYVTKDGKGVPIDGLLA